MRLGKASAMAAGYAQHPGFTPSPDLVARRERRRRQLSILVESEQFRYYLLWSWVAPELVGPPPDADDLGMSTRQWKWQLLQYSKAVWNFHSTIVPVRISL